ncbi:Crp/Fnr family transcriptional regulator [Fusobacterium nucleatum]
MTLQKHFAKYISGETEQIEALCALFSERTLKKKEYLLREGEICKFEAFITKGLLRTYHIDRNGNEQVLFFGTEDWWVTDFDSFMHQTPSQLYIQALEDSELLIITPEGKRYAFEHIPITERLFRLMTLRTHIALQRRMIDALSKTAEERYYDFLSQYPHIARQLTNIQIAAYLGVTHEFVSKIRKRISKFTN